MSVMLRTIQTAVPSTVLHQPEVRDVFAAQPGLTRLGQRLISTSFDSAAIDTRYTVVEEFDGDKPAEGEAVFYDGQTNELRRPSTRTRNEVYAAKRRRCTLRRRARPWTPALTWIPPRSRT